MTIPVVLVPGWRDRARALRHLRAFLTASGWPEASVHAMEFRDRFGSNIEHAAEIARVIARMNGGSGPVDIVAHSMGGLATRYLLGQHAEGQRVRRAVFLGSPHSGTLAAWLAWGRGGAEMRPGSAFLQQLSQLPPCSAALFCLRSPLDLRILPGSSAFLHGASNRSIPSLGHRHLLRGQRVLESVRALLLAAQPLV